jgi:hypothetical protein
MLKSKIKIACVGNMNNSFFSVARHLRNLGYSADLFLVNEFEHFKPQSDTFDLQSIKNIVYEVNIPDEDILKIDKRKIFSIFEHYDYIIACGFSVAYLTCSGVIIDMVIPYGSDIYELPFFEGDGTRSEYVNLQKKQIAKYQKKGIVAAKDIIWDVTNDNFEQIVDRFQLKGKRHKYTFPFLYTPEFNWKNADYLIQNCLYKNEMEKLRAKYSFIAFNHIRQSWKNPLDEWSQKGNDRIFRAYSRFIKEVNANSCLIVFEYGSDVSDSKKLVQDLGLMDNVVWFPIAQRRNLMGMITYADVGIGEVGDYSWFSYGAIFEFLAMKKPVIHYRNDELYQNRESGLYPMYTAANEDQIFNALKECVLNPLEAERKANLAYEWFIRTVIDKPLSIITSAIDLKVNNPLKIKKSVIKLSLLFQDIISYQKLMNKINLRLQAFRNRSRAKTIGLQK